MYIYLLPYYTRYVDVMFEGSSQELCVRTSISFRRLSGDETYAIPRRFRLVADVSRRHGKGCDRRADVEIRQSYRIRRRRMIII